MEFRRSQFRPLDVRSDNYDLGVDGKPGLIELLAVDESVGPRQNLDAPLTGDATFSVWFNKNGNVPGDR